MPVVTIPLSAESSQVLQECGCCDVGCCEGRLADDDILEAEIIAATNNCATIGSKVDLNPNVLGSGIWQSSPHCLDPACINGVSLICHDGELRLVIALSQCTAGQGCPDGDTPGELINGQCDPMEFIYNVPLIALGPGFCGCCDGCPPQPLDPIPKLCGEIVVRVRKKIP